MGAFQYVSFAGWLLIVGVWLAILVRRGLLLHVDCRPRRYAWATILIVAAVFMLASATVAIVDHHATHVKCAAGHSANYVWNNC